MQTSCWDFVAPGCRLPCPHHPSHPHNFPICFLFKKKKQRVLSTPQRLGWQIRVTNAWRQVNSEGRLFFLQRSIFLCVSYFSRVRILLPSFSPCPFILQPQAGQNIGPCVGQMVASPSDSCRTDKTSKTPSSGPDGRSSCWTGRCITLMTLSKQPVRCEHSWWWSARER